MVGVFNDLNFPYVQGKWKNLTVFPPFYNCINVKLC